ncbi:unnamed protein product [Trichobilharzia regenti]|nr:unnamed protein product [Trichobilharzia regenti]
MESRGQYCRLGVYYGNKSPHHFTVFCTQVTCPDAMDVNEMVKAISIELQPGPDRLEAGTQVQQGLNVECLRPFTEVVKLDVSFL